VLAERHAARGVPERAATERSRHPWPLTVRSANHLTLDPVSTGGPGWDEYLQAFNEFCSANGGKPLFNQTPHLTHQQAQAAFASEIEQFQQLRRASDPHGRFYTPWFQQLFEGVSQGET